MGDTLILCLESGKEHMCKEIYLQYVSGANVGVVECWAPRIEVSTKLVYEYE